MAEGFQKIVKAGFLVVKKPGMPDADFSETTRSCTLIDSALLAVAEPFLADEQYYNPI